MIVTTRPTTPTTVPHTNGMTNACVMTSGEALKATTVALLAMRSHCSLYWPAGIPDAV